MTFDYIYTTVNENDLKQFLEKKGFQKFELTSTLCSSKEAFYIRSCRNEGDERDEGNERGEGDKGDKGDERDKIDKTESMPENMSKIVKHLSVLENNFVTYDYVGGLGNQLFGIYTVMSYGIRYNKKPIFIYKDISPSITYRTTYWNTLFRKLKTYNDSNFINWNKEIYENNDSTYHNENFENCNIIFKGYFQSYHNFIDKIDQINDIIGINLQKDEVKNTYEHLFVNNKKCIAIHFRIGDYKELQKYHQILSDDYYINCLREIENLENKNIYVFCEKEDYNLVNERMQCILKNVNQTNFQIISGKNDIEELFLISLCDYIITANSSFSWWSAIFSNHKNIFIPEKWFYSDTKKGLILDGWKKISTLKNIVLCFFGVIPRSIKYTYHSIQNNIINILKEQYNIDIYVFNLNIKNKKIDNTIVDQNDINIIPYKFYEDYDQDELDIEIENFKKNNIVKMRYDYSSLAIQNSIRQMYSEYRVGIFLEKNRNKYRTAIVCGPDYFIANKINCQDVEDSIKNNNFYTTVVNEGDGYTNGFYIGKPEVLMEPLKRYTSLSKYFPTDKDYEYILKRSIEDNNIIRNVTKLVFFKIRANKTFVWQGNHNIDYLKIEERENIIKEYNKLFNYDFLYKKFISILIPIYNDNFVFVEESVNSVINQTYENWELIIGINDCVSEKILKNIKKYEDMNSKIKVVKILKKHKSELLNDMIKLCHYDYVALLNVEDKWESNKLETQNTYLSLYDVVGSKCVYFGDINNIIPNIPSGDISNFDFISFNPIINSSAIVKKDLCYWNKNVERIEDYDMWLRLRFDNKKFYNCPNILVKHRRLYKIDSSNSFSVQELIKKYKEKIFFKFIPNILYINLAKRTDRKEHFLNNFSETNNNIIRIDAVYDENGAFGCLQSHIKALEYAKNLGEYTLICEDDFQFRDINYTIKKLEQIFDKNLNWDILMLGHNCLSSISTKYENIIKIYDAQTSSGYVVKNNYIDALLNIYKKDLANFRETKVWKTEYCVDMSWKKLQRKDNWYAFVPQIGFQRESYSDIEKKNVNYVC